MTALVSATDLDPGTVVLLDVRWALATGSDQEGYAAGHLPGAAFVDLDHDLADPPGAGGRHPLPAPQRFVAAMRCAGVGVRTPVVVYDDLGGMAAARAWWLLRDYGHPAVRLLDGGLGAWQRYGGALETGTPPVAPGDFDGRPGSMSVVDAEQAAVLGRAGALVDVRAPERFRGEHEPVDAVAGHVPGAVNLPTTANLGPEQLFKPVDELRSRFAGVESGAAAYCGSGVNAAHTVLALELVGVHAALYPGSWSGWITDPDRPVATGT